MMVGIRRNYYRDRKDWRRIKERLYLLNYHPRVRKVKFPSARSRFVRVDYIDGEEEKTIRIKFVYNGKG